MGDLIARGIAKKAESRLANMHIDVSVAPYEVKGLNIQHDTDMMKQAILDAGVNGSLFIPNSFEINDSLSFLTGQKVKGGGLDKTVISANIPKVIIYPPKGKGGLDGISIDGKRNPNSIGIMIDDDHNPYNGVWGSVYVKYCGKGLAINLITKGSAYSRFNYLGFWECGIGMDLTTAQQGWFNANTFGYVFLHMCDTGVIFNNLGIGLDGLSFDYLEAENCQIGLNVIKCKEINIKDGWLEDNVVKNMVIAAYPAVNGFTFAGNSDDDSNTKTDYAFSRESSVMMTYVKGGNFRAMRGRWWFDELQSMADNPTSGRMNNPILRGYGQEFKDVPSGSTIDVTSVNVIFLNHTVPTEITDLTRSGDYATHQSLRFQQVTIIANSANAYIRHGGKFALNKATDWRPSRSNATLTLVYNHLTSLWVEIARTERATVSNPDTMTYSGDGVATTKVIPHGLAAVPKFFPVYASSVDAGNADIKFVAADATNITVTFKTAPIAGTNNVKLTWKAEL